jgi:hypothetical protein
MARQKLQIPHMVTIGSKSAAVIFNMGQKKWKGLYDQVYHRHIRSYDSANERRYVLFDVMALAYPSADTRTLHMMCQEFTFRRADHRMKFYGGSRNGEDLTDEA